MLYRLVIFGDVDSKLSKKDGLGKRNMRELQ